MSGVRRCKACGVFVQEGDRFCWSCGLELAQVDVTEVDKAPVERISSPVTGIEIDHKLALTLRKAYLLQRRGQLGEAEKVMRETVNDWPEEETAWSMLAAILRQKGDLVEAVAAAQKVSNLAEKKGVMGKAVEWAREERSKVEEQVVRELKGARPRARTPLEILGVMDGLSRSVQFVYGALAGIGLIGFIWALGAVLSGRGGGHVWFGVSLAGAGWCYYDAERKGLSGLFWALFAFILGPLGVLLYVISG